MAEPSSDAGKNTFPFPLLKAADIESAFKDITHEYNPEAKIQRAPLSDLTGIKDGFGVAMGKLPPNGESTTMHYHLLETQWIYVVSGTGTLRLLDASLPTFGREHPREPHPLPSSPPTLTAAQITEHPVGPGDFAGFAAGVFASKYAHSLVGGPEGMTYLMGGTRAPVEVCSYPLVGKTIIFDENVAVTAAVPPSSDPKCNH